MAPKRVTQAWAASVLGVTDRTFRRWVARYEAGGLAALKDKRVAGPSPRRASPEEVAALEALYRDGCAGWNVLHFYHEVYAGEHGGARSYTWVKSRLQEAGLVRKGRRKGAHRLRRERKPAEGMMLHQDASTHEWAPGQGWDLVVTMDDATSGVYSGFFVEEEGTLAPTQTGVAGGSVDARFCRHGGSAGAHRGGYWSSFGWLRGDPQRLPAGRVHPEDPVRGVPMSHFWSAVVALALALPAPAVAQDQLDTLRIDSLMAIAADRIQTAALAAAKEAAIPRGSKLHRTSARLGAIAVVIKARTLTSDWTIRPVTPQTSDRSPLTSKTLPRLAQQTLHTFPGVPLVTLTGRISEKASLNTAKNGMAVLGKIPDYASAIGCPFEVLDLLFCVLAVFSVPRSGKLMGTPTGIYQQRHRLPIALVSES